MSGDIFTAPILKTIGEGIIVQRPEGAIAPPQIGEHGGISVGSEYLDGAGDVVYIALHHPDGTTLVGCLGHGALTEFSIGMNRVVARIYNGQRKAETRQ